MQRIMRRALLRTMVLSVLLTLAVSGVAWAHTTVSPEEVSAGATETFTVNTPGEKEIPIVEEKVEVPEGFEVSSVDSPDGWQGSIEGGSIVWSGGEIAEGEEQEFTFEAQTPDQTGEYAWSAFDTYEDGSVSEWSGPEGSPVEVVSGEAHAENGHASHAGTDEDLPDTGGISSAILYAAGAICIMALGAALRLRLRKV